MKFSLNKRGQEEAPFELLVAVIMMGFVLIVGLSAWTYVSKVQCEQSIGAKLEDLKDSIELVAGKRGTKELSFTLPECYNEAKHSVRLDPSYDPLVCSSVCGGSQGSCVILKLAAEDLSVPWNCVVVAPTINFPLAADVCEPMSGYNLVDLKGADSIPTGYYKLVSAYIESDVPYVCAYRKV